MKKVCKVIWSTNRLEYLIPTLKSQRSMLDFSGCEVHGIFIDDMPKNRHDGTVYELAKMFGYNEIILHQENQGISKNWTQTFKMLSERDYDYVYHTEDDVTITKPVKITDLIDILEKHQELSQICLTRQAWYENEVDPVIDPTDIRVGDYYMEYSEDYFWSLASFYPRNVTEFPYHEYTQHNLSEWVVANVLKNINLKTGKLKNATGPVNMCEHIGGYSIGKRLEPGEPGWEKFHMYDPQKKYNSRNGSLWK